MAYTPTEWKDRVVEKPRTYTIQDNGDGTFTLTPAPGTIHETGTPANAPNLNKLEQGIADAAATADAALPESGGTMSGPLTRARSTQNYEGFGTYTRIFETNVAIGSIPVGAQVITFNAWYDTAAAAWKSITAGVAEAISIGAQKAQYAKSQSAAAANEVLTWSTYDIITSAGGQNIGPYSGVTNALLKVRNSGNSIEWGHNNPAGYQAVLGANNGNGHPFIAFYADAGTNLNTYRTRGFRGAVITPDMAGEVGLVSLPNANADNQTGTWNKFWHRGDLRTTNGYLEYNDAGTWKAVGGVKTVHRGTTTIGPGAATVNVTVPTTAAAGKVALTHLSYYSNAPAASDMDAGELIRGVMTTSTNLAIACGASSYSEEVSWEVTEYY